MKASAKRSELNNDQKKSLNGALLDAVVNKNLARVEMCLNKGATTDIRVSVPEGMHFVNGKSVPNMRSYPLSYVAYRGFDPVIFELLVKNGMNVNAQDDKGQTVLMYAAQAGEADRIDLFLTFRADALLTDKEGETALSYALKLKIDNPLRDKIVDTLLTAIPDKEGAVSSKAAFNEKRQPVTLDKPVPTVKPITFAPKTEKSTSKPPSA